MEITLCVVCMFAALLDFSCSVFVERFSSFVLLKLALTFWRQSKCGPLLLSELETDISPRAVFVASLTSLKVFF